MEEKNTEVDVSKKPSFAEISAFLDDKIKKQSINEPIFIDPNESEKLSDSYVAGGGMGEGPFCYLRPHNCRRQIKINSLLDSCAIAVHSHTTIWEKLSEIKKPNEKNAISFKNYKGSNITLQIYPDSITAMWNQKQKGRKKETYRFQGTRKDLVVFLHLMLEDVVKHKLDYFIDEFMKGYGITAVSNKEWGQRDFWLKPSSSKLNLPQDMLLHHSQFFKVYKGGYEIRLDPGESIAKIVNHISNNNIIDLVPELTEELEKIHNKIEKINPLIFLKEKIKSFEEACLYSDEIKLLKISEKKDLFWHIWNLQAQGSCD